MIKELFGMMALAVALVYVSGLDHDDAVLQDQNYCEMVAIWNDDARAGIAPAERNGWPPYNKAINCEVTL
jgi:hypothetical protein